MNQLLPLGPRERQLLAILRRAETPLTTRDLLDAVRERGDGVAYTTVKRTAERLVEKGLLDRESERHDGTVRHRYGYDADAAADRLVPALAAELRAVLGPSAVERLADGVRRGPRGDDRDRHDRIDEADHHADDIDDDH